MKYSMKAFNGLSPTPSLPPISHYNSIQFARMPQPLSCWYCSCPTYCCPICSPGTTINCGGSPRSTAAFKCYTFPRIISGGQISCFITSEYRWWWSLHPYTNATYIHNNLTQDKVVTKERKKEKKTHRLLGTNEGTCRIYCLILR